MLYERWCQIAKEYRNEIALHDVARGERWTFGQLLADSENISISDLVAFPQGHNFISTLLAGWRLGKATCPLEVEQNPPNLVGLPKCDHLKITSATTGQPRLITFTGEQLAADVDNIVATMGLRRDWPNLGTISLAHSYGFSNLVLPLLLHGIPLILVDAPLPETLRIASGMAESITLAAVPALWRTWHGANAIPKNVRLAISAGAPLSLSLEEAVYEGQGIKIHNFYGSSECGGIAYDSSDVPRQDVTCAGAPMRNVSLSVGQDYCLEVRSNATGLTYWPEATARLVPGYFHTSDLAEISDGLVYIRGRAGDQINVAGRKVSPESIERVLLSHPSIDECLVFGVESKDEERKEIIVACLVGKEQLQEQSLKHFLLQRLPAWQIPRDWIFVKSMEANQRGKLSRAEWRKKYLALRKSDSVPHP
ncbi:class I adenylate-forming enzyme family protein [Pedosphaera parvula]|uniref:AMP-dependent synthetase and ligase n=1 Tax=Pedosphaera parvula (strain Ellin514) TaxID=320771 RepID=B9XGB6_PEDPL|nr:fatty acid--CoA ligase family protein [Pedosphaera parvula]EEF61278.1 AMP-dependent synthetase and ligase [Pedosphaera parvula Ellin514]